MSAVVLNKEVSVEAGAKEDHRGSLEVRLSPVAELVAYIDAVDAA